MKVKNVESEIKAFRKAKKEAAPVIGNRLL
jgi:hypothetical protein